MIISIRVWLNDTWILNSHVLYTFMSPAMLTFTYTSSIITLNHFTLWVQNLIWQIFSVSLKRSKVYVKIGYLIWEFTYQIYNSNFFVTILTLEVISMNWSFFLQIYLLGIKMRNNNEIIESVKESTAYQGQTPWRRSKTLLTKSQNFIPSQYFLLLNL